MQNQITKEGIMNRFFGRQALGLLAAGATTEVLENPTEELIYNFNRGSELDLFGRVTGKKKKFKMGVRKEENYLYSTRRFPSNTANNTIGSGAIVADDYDFFGNGIGDGGGAMGYFSVGNLGYQQTNMDKGGKIPKGRGFLLYELAVSFNAAAPPADIVQCLDSMSLKFEKQAGQLSIYHGPIRNWPGGVGMSGYGFATTTATTTTIQGTYGSSGVPTLQNVRRFKNPRVLNANDSFVYRMHATATTPAMNVTIALSTFVEISIWLFGLAFDQIPE